MGEEINFEKKTEFILEEYRCLRSELDWQIREKRTLERYVLIAIGATYAWLVAFSNPSLSLIPIWFMPLLIVYLVEIRAKTISVQVKNLMSHIGRIENIFYKDEPEMGWIRNFDNKKVRVPSGLGKSHSLFWRVAFITTLTFSILGSFNVIASYYCLTKSVVNDQTMLCLFVLNNEAIAHKNSTPNNECLK